MDVRVASSTHAKTAAGTSSHATHGFGMREIPGAPICPMTSRNRGWVAREARATPAATPTIPTLANCTMCMRVSAVFLIPSAVSEASSRPLRAMRSTTKRATMRNVCPSAIAAAIHVTVRSCAIAPPIVCEA